MYNHTLIDKMLVWNFRYVEGLNEYNMSYKDRCERGTVIFLF